MKWFSPARTWAVFIKEFQQMLRDRLTFAMAVGVPVMQLVLFGYAINTDPKGLPTAVVAADAGPLARSLVASLQNTGYFKVVHQGTSQTEADALVAEGEVQFMIVIPPGFSRDVVRGERPAVLVSVDATDPSASGNAIAALGEMTNLALRHDLTGPLQSLQKGAAPFELRIHRRYNPEGLSRYNIVPGLIGTILTMTMVMLTSLAMTRERERGTMENLLATPVRPLEVMVGKILPYVVIGYVQLCVILGAAWLLFEVPMVGSFVLLMAMIGVFMVANLAVGFTFSTIARNQLQAMQMTFFFFLPSMLLSGFMFPFRGMPVWAQWLGEGLPLTHFLRIVRGIMLKGNQAPQLWADLWPMLLFLAVAGTVALKRYRQTLD
ncbi:MAG: ABC transporter permease [Gammaproteobacteria bacterium]|jgi:ABC-2 type transport system permease protein|uniref:ABC transporter permease n=1 Tax=Hydrogenophaga sp. TaxID=1904254 RepID=UPI0025BA6693|nr:ABC transporter permease [Hydrogenophaga sp.]MBU4183254.1 ABC transporter permease [Gammaproteobacteria bacterium]MBU4283141.1 ABC transporter permease [Gammaproteobacteria bacterium]MBU4323679.1 ABC transporter permease [Gammaproteobacteria bacterium]MBU4507938.1 ABC transporter permease [Gammaproteobacteria bacterium]MCG2656530.1 ABC transporter permease [Hydrogenophaga sp.]